MSRLVVALLLLLAISCLARPAWCDHVVVLQPTDASSEASHVGTHAMIAELALAGFTVSVEKLEPEGDLSQTLATVAARPGVMASVSVERCGEVSCGYVWLQQASSMIVVSERANQPVVAHSVVVLKITELLIEHRDGTPSSEREEVPAVASSPLHVEPAQPKFAAAVEPSRTLRAWLGGGVGMWSSSRVLAARLDLGIELQLARQVGFTLAGAFPLSSFEIESELGAARVRATDLEGGFSINVVRAAPFALSLGPGVGIRFLDATASGLEGTRNASTHVLIFGGSLRAIYHLAAAVKLSVLLGGRWSTPEPRLTNGTERDAMLGAMSWSAMMQAGWELPL